VSVREEQALWIIEHSALLREIVQVEPEVREMLLKVASLPPNPNMSKWEVYEELKQHITPYIGWYARNPRLGTSPHYEAFIHFIVALLPEDEDILELEVCDA
jgi:hypothetical protein